MDPKYLQICCKFDRAFFISLLLILQQINEISKESYRNSVAEQMA